MMKSFRSIMLYGCILSALILGWGITLLILNAPTAPEVNVVYSNFDYFENSQDKYMVRTATGYVADLNGHILYNCKLRYTLTMNGETTWSSDVINADSGFYFHEGIPFSQLNIQDPGDIEQVETSFEVLEYEIPWTPWRFIGELLILIGAGFLIATIIIAVKSCRAH